MNHQHARAEAIVARLYDGMGSTQDWCGALDALGEGIGASVFHAVTVRRADLTVVSGYSSTHAPPADVSDYEAHRSWGDERLRVARQLQPGAVMLDHEHFDARAMSRSPLYAGWLQPLGLRHTAALVIGADADTFQVLGCLRARGDGAYADADRALCVQVMPHLLRANALRERLAQLGMQAAIGATLLQALPHGVAVLDTRGHVHWLNAQAERLAAQGGAWRVARNVWRMREADLNTRLQALLARACARWPHAAAGMLRVADGMRGWTASVLPLGAAHPLAAPRTEPLALLVMAEAGAVVASADALCELLGLSPTEARLAREMARGMSIKQFAAQEGCSWHTARTHLKNLMHKTGCHRQMELVQLVQSLRMV